MSYFKDIIKVATSLPAWGAWIEMQVDADYELATARSPHGERGLKFD